MVAPIRGGGAGQGNQVGFLLPIQASGASAPLRTAIERRVQSLLGKHVSHSDEGRRAHLQGFADLFIGPAWPVLALVCPQQHSSMEQLPGGLDAGGDHLVYLLALF